jgi:hypothetical protein
MQKKGPARRRSRRRRPGGAGRTGVPRVIRGARKLADYIFGDEDEFKSVYGLRAALGLFYLNGRLCGRPEHIDERIAEREREAASTANIADQLGA